MAARIHWRFIVRDQYGRAIQNAAVNVYQPGTSNAFTGAAYDAYTAGSVKTNPFISNAQGEVEGYFDTPQRVDINVTSNSGTAYYAGFPTQLVSFTPFTETEELRPDVTDMPTAIGVVGDIIAITTATQTAAIGTSGKWAPSDHRHAHTDAWSINPHGADNHTDITRTFWLNHEGGTLDSGTAGTIGSTPNLVRVTALADAATQGVYWNFVMPSDYVAGTVTATPFWIPGSTDGVAHTVRWTYVAKTVAVGSDASAAGTTTAWTGASATRTANFLVSDTATSIGVTPGVGDVVKLTVQRIGGDGADTYVGVVNLVGVLISYTANQ